VRRLRGFGAGFSSVSGAGRSPGERRKSGPLSNTGSRRALAGFLFDAITRPVRAGDYEVPAPEGTLSGAI
jgi:hypothetical protein